MFSSYRSLWTVASILLHFAIVEVVAFSPLSSSSANSELRSMIAIKRAASAWAPRALGSRTLLRPLVVAAPILRMSTDTNPPAEKTEEEKAAIKAAREARK